MSAYPFAADIEVNGRTIYSVIDGLPIFKKTAYEILGERGIGTPRVDGGLSLDPNGWYSQAAWLDAFDKISKLGRRLAAAGGPSALFCIGVQIPNNADFPPWVEDIDSAIRAIDIAYHMNHRRRGQIMFDPDSGAMMEGIGHYGYQRISDEPEIISVCQNPYPCEFDMGILTAMATRFEPDAQVTHDPMPAACRKRGATECTYRIAW